MKKYLFRYLSLILFGFTLFYTTQAEKLEKSIKKAGASLVKTKKSKIPLVKKEYTALNTEQRRVILSVLEQQLKKYMKHIEELEITEELLSFLDLDKNSSTKDFAENYLQKIGLPYFAENIIEYSAKNYLKEKGQQIKNASIEIAKELKLNDVMRDYQIAFAGILKEAEKTIAELEQDGMEMYKGVRDLFTNVKKQANDSIEDINKFFADISDEEEEVAGITTRTISKLKSILPILIKKHKVIPNCVLKKIVAAGGKIKNITQTNLPKTKKGLVFVATIVIGTISIPILFYLDVDVCSYIPGI